MAGIMHGFENPANVDAGLSYGWESSDSRSLLARLRASSFHDLGMEKDACFWSDMYSHPRSGLSILYFDLRRKGIYSAAGRGSPSDSFSVVSAASRPIRFLERARKWMVRQDQSDRASQSRRRAVEGRPNPNFPRKRVLLNCFLYHRSDQMPHPGNLADDQDFGRGKRGRNHAHPPSQIPSHLDERLVRRHIA